MHVGLAVSSNKKKYVITTQKMLQSHNRCKTVLVPNSFGNVWRSLKKNLPSQRIAQVQFDVPSEINYETCAAAKKTLLTKKG